MITLLIMRKTFYLKISHYGRSRSRTPARSRLGPRVPVKARLGLKRDVKWRLGARRRVRDKGLEEKNFLFSTLDQVEIFWVNPSISG